MIGFYGRLPKLSWESQGRLPAGGDTCAESSEQRSSQGKSRDGSIPSSVDNKGDIQPKQQGMRRELSKTVLLEYKAGVRECRGKRLKGH